ncbi:hypothetical protein BDZ45DRAFT_374870 [Acephala macrosclerotiorum]|nr:hypothetical protein BDZ45DRAFT_374870 [Acephala macrosclerotiorum]
MLVKICSWIVLLLIQLHRNPAFNLFSALCSFALKNPSANLSKCVLVVSTRPPTKAWRQSASTIFPRFGNMAAPIVLRYLLSTRAEPILVPLRCR